MKVRLKRTVAILLSVSMVISLLCATAFALNTEQTQSAAVDDGAISVSEAIGSGTCGENLIWTLDDSGILTISGHGEMAIWDLTPPWDDSGDKIKRVVLKNGVTSISDNAFHWYDNLTSISIPDSVTRIDDDAFRCLCSLTDIQVADGNVSYSSQDGVLFDKSKSRLILYPAGKAGTYSIPDSVAEIKESAFYGCSSLTKLTLPDSVANIGDCAFQSCDNLVSIDLGNGVTTIGDAAFAFCPRLTGVTLPGSVTNVNELTFSGCDNLSDIFVDASNASFSSYKGVLFNKKRTTLICCPDGRTGAYVVPNSVTNIGASAFENCEKLTSITIPKTVRSIGNDAFVCCVRLTDIYYGGSKSNWNAIFRDDAGSLEDVKIHFNSTGTTQKTQTITAKSYTKTLGDTAFRLGAKTNGDGKLTYKSSNTKVVTISSTGKITIKGVGSAKITITAAATKNYKKAVKSVTITVNPTGTKLSSLTNLSGKKMKVTWKKNSKVTGYQTQYSTSSKFSSAKTVTVKSYKTTSSTISKLTKNKKYYVRIRTYKTVSGKNYYSSWSGSKNVTIKK